MLSSLKAAFPPAILALADGTVFIGNSIGSSGTTVGEVVFNTAMTGYQEILTDPSYCQQIVTLTYPHIGNYGVNEEDMESSKVQAAGLVIRDLPLIASNFRAQQNLSQFLNAQGAVAIANIDTRKLTRLLREKGTQNGAIVGLAASEAVTPERIAAAIAAAKNAPSMAGLDLARVVSTQQPYAWEQTEWELGQGFGKARHTYARLLGKAQVVLIIKPCSGKQVCFRTVFRPHGGHQQAAFPVHHNVAVAVEVGGNNRQAHATGLGKGQAKGFLNVVGRRNKHVCRRVQGKAFFVCGAQKRHKAYAHALGHGSQGLGQGGMFFCPASHHQYRVAL